MLPCYFEHAGFLGKSCEHCGKLFILSPLFNTASVHSDHTVCSVEAAHLMNETNIPPLSIQRQVPERRHVAADGSNSSKGRREGTQRHEAGEVKS